jgi:hypothetical protein
LRIDSGLLVLPTTTMGTVSMRKAIDINFSELRDLRRVASSFRKRLEARDPRPGIVINERRLHGWSQFGGNFGNI